MTFAEAKKYGDVQGVIKGTYAELYRYTDEKQYASWYNAYATYLEKVKNPDQYNVRDVDALSQLRYSFVGQTEKLFSLQKKYVNWFAQHAGDLIANEDNYNMFVKNSEVLYDAAIKDLNGETVEKYGVSVVTDVSYDPVLYRETDFVPVLLQSAAMAVIDFVIRDEVYGGGEILKTIAATTDPYKGALDIVTNGGKSSLLTTMSSGNIVQLNQEVDRMLKDAVDVIDPDGNNPPALTESDATKNAKRLSLLQSIYYMYSEGQPLYVRANAFEWYPMFDTTALEAEYKAAKAEVNRIRTLMLASGAASLI